MLYHSARKVQSKSLESVNDAELLSLSTSHSQAVGESNVSATSADLSAVTSAPQFAQAFSRAVHPPTSQMFFNDSTHFQPQSAPIGTLAHFDPIWAQQVGISVDEIDQVKSHLNIDSLYYASVLRLGDQLVVSVKAIVNGSTQEANIHLTVRLSEV